MVCVLEETGIDYRNLVTMLQKPKYLVMRYKSDKKERDQKTKLFQAGLGGRGLFRDAIPGQTSVSTRLLIPTDPV